MSTDSLPLLPKSIHDPFVLDSQQPPTPVEWLTGVTVPSPTSSLPMDCMAAERMKANPNLVYMACAQACVDMGRCCLAK